MIYCDECGKKNDWPIWSMSCQSYGPCEVCGKTRGCNDVPSRALPIPKRPRDKTSVIADDEMITDEMVEAALTAYDEKWRDESISCWTVRREAIRAAIIAAITAA
jgi:hypothetical protein